ncbi:DUF4192 domain-containing protein [Actinoplanes sp. CA-030573]|uniref:DUF4192 domain-containing protein n=1 Tax=Actinoplanes sp. CA-030573 TaxID=3239898 RepID=UPI003D903690
MTPDCMITVSSSAEAVAVTPYMLGFHPTDSLVVLGLFGRLVDFVVRYDFPPPDHPSALEEAAELVAAQGAGRVIVLGYGPPGPVSPAVLELAHMLREARVRVEDTLRVHDGRWWSYESRGPAEGTACSLGLAAGAVFQGLVALPDRKALVAQLAPLEGEAGREAEAATVRARARRASLPDDAARRAGREAIREAERIARSGGEPTGDEYAWLNVLLAEQPVLEHGIDRTSPERWRARLWTEAVRRAEPTQVAAPATLLGFAAWRAGDGALARVAVDRALQAAPGHRYAAILDRLLGAGIRPSTLVSMRPLPPRGRRRRRPARGRAIP